MKQLISLLLIPMFVLGHVMPHSHAGTGVAESNDHASRPHLHLSVAPSHHHDGDHDDGAKHEQHGDDSVDNDSDSHGNASYSLPREHDDDAIYVAQDIASHARSLGPLSVDCGDCGNARDFLGDLRVSTANVLRNRAPDRYAVLPIYLLVASLRL